MRSDYRTMREVVTGFSTAAGPSSDGLATLRPRPPLHCEAPDALALPGPGREHPQPDYLHDLRQTFVRRSSSTDYEPEPLDAEPLVASVQAALVEDLRTWDGDGDADSLPAGFLEPFVLLLRPRGARPGLYRVRPDGVDLVGPLPDPEEVEGMTVQKEFARAGAIVSVAANLDQADTWAGAHGYRHAMVRSAALIYSVHLRSTARGLAGTVFAGFASSAVRDLLSSDGVSRHQMFAVTVAAPRRAEPS